MNRYPKWVNWLVLIVVVAGGIIALPNIYGDDLAVFVGRSDNQPVAETQLSEIRLMLDEADIQYLGTEIDDGAAIVRFASGAEQLRASDLLSRELSNYRVAQTLAPRVPAWMAALGLEPMNLGLDLRGGVQFLFEVDLQGAIGTLLENYENTLRTEFREADIRARVELGDGTLSVTMVEGEADMDRAEEIIEDLDDPGVIVTTPRLLVDRTEIDGRPGFRIRPTEVLLTERRNFAIEQNIVTLNNRVNELGVAETNVQRQGLDRILVELPGVQDPARAKELLGGTATLEYRPTDEENDPYEAERRGRPPLGSELLYDQDGLPILVRRDIIVTGNQIIDATPGFDENRSPAVNITLDGPGGDRMLAFTRNNVGNRMSVVFIEEIPETVERNGEEVVETRTERTVISNAVIQGVFSNRFQTTGLTAFQARELALLLRAGALAAPIVMVDERTIGPSLGADNIERGRLAIVVGFLLVIVFMAVYYRFFGLVANMALLSNLVLMIAALSLLPTALTLPGIAGIVLTVGMAVDANVLIFERIREEIRNGNSPQASIKAGYEKAFSSIADANITTLIAALVLFAYGTGPIKGFAVTLSIGIVTSMFTAIVGTRVVVNLIYGRRKNIERLSIGAAA
ncbi:MAG TPA: protein translocase subunit SecD [Gammaproteobacteria bacterium]|nr:protein translocase subunit SecD [Gammaproteobacteria bacterium]